MAEKQPKQNQQTPDSLINILDKIRADKKLSTSACWNDQNLIRDGILARAKDEMINYASQWRVDPQNLEAATAELANAAGKRHVPLLILGTSKTDNA